MGWVNGNGLASYPEKLACSFMRHAIFISYLSAAMGELFSHYSD